MKKMAIKMKRQFPYTEREFHLRSGCDEKFDRLSRTHEKAKIELRNSLDTCLAYAAKKLLNAARLFDQTDPDISKLTWVLPRAIGDVDITTIGIALQDFCQSTTFPPGGIESPEGSFVYACRCLNDALEMRRNDALDQAYADSIRCRSALKFTGE